jgi:hypothetical protein
MTKLTDETIIYIKHFKLIFKIHIFYTFYKFFKAHVSLHKTLQVQSSYITIHMTLHL